MTMKTKTKRSENLKGLIEGSAYPSRISPVQLGQAAAEIGRHYKARNWAASTAKLLASAEADRARGTIARDTILDMESAIAAAVRRCANLRLREIVTLRYCGPDADLIMPKRRNAVASIRLRPNISRKSPTRIRLDKETTSTLRAYLRNYRPIAAKQRGDGDPTLLFPRRCREGDGSARADHALRMAFWTRMREARVLPRDPEPRYVRARLVLDVLLPRWTDGLESGRLVIHGRAVTARTI